MTCSISRSTSRWLLAALVGARLVAPTGARADATVSGTVTADGGPVAGAFVAITNADARYGTVTGVDGSFSVAGVATGTYTVAAQAQGFAVAQATGVAVATDPVTQDLALVSSGAKFTALGVFGAQVARIAADGQSGVFYASTSVIPQIYRTVDYGGTWTQVTLAVDDPSHGLTQDNVAGGLVASGFPGEVASIVQNSAWYSTDFGLTWKAVAGTPANSGGDPNGGELHWVHGGTTSVLLSVSATETKRADMTAGTPTFATITGMLPANGRMATASSSDAAWAAVVDGSGNLAVYQVDATSDPLTQVGTTLGGFPAPPTFVRLGGAKGTGAPPAAVLVYSATANSATLATKDPAGTQFVAGDLATVAIGGGCGAGPGAVGAVSPLSEGANGAATVSQCFLQKAGSSLSPTAVNGINNNTGLVFDATYGSSPNFVVISGDGGRGLVKSVTSGVPTIPPGDATAGFDPGAGAQGGTAVNGLNVPVVKDSVFGPAGASQFAAILSGSGGRLAVASDDGGATITTAMQNGGRAAAWWQGASETWLVFGGGGGGPLLAAIADWTAATPALPGPNVPGTDGSAIGIAGNFDVTALAGVPGTGTVFIGGGTDVDQQGAAGSLVRASLTAGDPPTLGGITAIAGSEITAAVRALAYCPALGADTDVILVGTATGTNAGAPAGGVVRVTDATGAASASTVSLGTTPALVNDLRAHCDSGTVYAGIGSNGGGPSGGLYKSTDGGLTFAPVTIAGAGLPPSLNIQVVAVNPSDPDEVLVAGNSEGFILRSTDGGTSWSVVNDPHAPGGRNFLSEGVGDLEIPPSSGAIVTGRAVSSSNALVGTGGGLFSADVRDATPCDDDADCGDGDPCTTDTCAGASCTNPPVTGLDGALCRAGQLDASVCGSETLPKKLAGPLAKKGAKVRRLLEKARSNTRRAAKMSRSVANLLAGLQRKVAKAATKGQISGGCRTAIESVIEEIRALL